MWFRCDPYKKAIEALKNKHSDISARVVKCRGETVTILCIRQLTDRVALSNFVIRPFMEYCRSARKAPKAAEVMESVLYADDCTTHTGESAIERHILNGFTVMLFSHDREYVVVNLKKVSHRPVAEPELQYNLRSPRDCFVENLDVNLSLLRYRLKDRNLRVENLEAGARTRTKIALVYIEDIANDTCINELKKRIADIRTDSIIESGELQAFLMNTRMGFFPIMKAIERSDYASEELMEGKAIVLVDGSPLALSAPAAFIEFLYTCDDRYDNKFFSAFARLIRFAGFFLSFTASSYWLALVSFHSDILPAGFIISMAEARAKVPFSALLGVLLLEFIVELIRESLLRVPNKIGSAIAIVSAIIIGQASISAGVFSALLLIVLSVEFLASFAVPSQFAMNPFRVIKFVLILITGMFGFYGFILGITVFMAELVSVNSFGVPYFAPFGPFNLYDFLRTIMFSRTTSNKRQQYMRNKDDKRAAK